MLYDPKWEKETKAHPLSVGALIAWLERQPAEKIYCYSDSGRCLAAQYCRAIGKKYMPTYLSNGQPSRDNSFDYKLEWVACAGPWTFGAALSRARALLTD